MAGMSEQLDRFARGELSPAESRELAQRALSDPDLFDELASIAVAKDGLAAGVGKPVLWPRIAVFAAAAAIIAGVVALYGPRRNSRPPVAPISAAPILLARN